MYWRGYSWSLLSMIAIVWVICLDRLPTPTFNWLNGLDIVLCIFGFIGLFRFAYGGLLFPSSFWKFIFWVFVVRWAIMTWVCAFPDVWNTWNTGIFIVAEILLIMMWFPMYLALYRTAYPYGGSPSTISEESGSQVNAS